MTVQQPIPITPATPAQLYGITDAPELAERRPAPTIDLVVLLRILRIRRKAILGAALATVVLTLIVLFQMTPLYSASAIVMLDQQKSNIEGVQNVLSGLPTDQASLQDQVQILTSRDLAGRVIDKLNLKDDPYFTGHPGLMSRVMALVNPMKWLPMAGKTQAAARGEDAERNALIDAFESHLTVTPMGMSTAIKVTYESPSPEQAARIDNAIADAYVEDQLNAKFDATRKATQWLSDRIQELSKQSESADAAVQQYRAANGLTDTAGGASIVDQQMTDISTQLVTARSALAEKRATHDHVTALARAGRAADISQATASPLIATLRAQETDLMRQEADLSSKYGARNPKMLELQSQKANLEAKINEEVGRVVQSVSNDVSVAEAHVASLQSSLNHIEGQSGEQSQLRVKLTALQSASSSAKSMYEAFLSKLNQTQGQQGIQTPDARIISRAPVPRSAAYPNKMLVMSLAVPGGLLLGLMLAFLMERLDSGFRTTYQVENMLGLPVLATIPEVGGEIGRSRTAADRIIDKPMSSYAEAIRGLQLSLTLSNVDRKPKVIVVTSSVPAEGKTTIAVSLARLAARSGLRTVLVDADLRRPTVAQTTGVKPGEHGLVEAVTGEVPLDRCFVKDSRSDLLILSCVKRPVNPSDMLGSNAMRQLVGNLTRAFDVVIIDSAPVLPVNDTKILSQLADTVLFVARWEKTPREAVATALRSLRDVHAPVAGVALARADMSRFQYYSYGYQDYYYYNKYYVN